METCRGEVLLSYNEGKFRTAIAMACSFLRVEEIYPDQEKALNRIFKGSDIVFSSHTFYFRPIIRLERKIRSVYKIGKNEQSLMLENNTKVLSND